MKNQPNLCSSHVFFFNSNIVALPWAANLPHRHLLDHFLSKVNN